MLKILSVLWFYVRFLPSFTRPGFQFRRLLWRKNHRKLTGQTWLVTGASGGIGEAICENAAARGANVIAVARNQDKLDQLKTAIPNSLTTLQCDLSLKGAIIELAETLKQFDKPIDVLVNNVGVLLDEHTFTPEGHESMFATNLLGHFLLTEKLKKNEALDTQATIISMSSGGMYNVPLMIEQLEVRSGFSGMTAYAFHKRAQVVLNDYWRQHSSQRKYYVMHPGWVDTQGVKTSLPRFRKLLQWVLRKSSDGADTALWLASVKPEQETTGIWFDRALRPAHLYSSTEKTSASAEQLVSFLKIKVRQDIPSNSQVLTGS